MVSFPDDQAVVVTTKHSNEEEEVYVTETVKLVISWLERAKLILADEK